MPARRADSGGLDQAAKGNVVAYYFQKIAKGKDSSWEKDELLDVIYWLRQVLAIVQGLIWGLVPLTGLLAFLGFLATNTMLMVSFYKSWLGVDEEDYGGHADFMSEGLANAAMPLFLVVWVITYTAFQT